MRPLSVLPLARPRPGKCFAVAAIPFVCRPPTNARAICAFQVREREKAREPRKLPAEPGVSTTGAKSMSIPTERSAAAAPAAWDRATDGLVIWSGASVGGAQASRLTIPPSWSTAIRSGSPRVHAACWSSAVTVAAVRRVSQPLPRSTTPPIFPLRIRVRNLRLGGATRVPITVSAVSENPVTTLVSFTGSALGGPGSNAVTTATAATAASPRSGVLIADRVTLHFDGAVALIAAGGPGLD